MLTTALIVFMDNAEFTEMLSEPMEYLFIIVFMPRKRITDGLPV